MQIEKNRIYVETKIAKRYTFTNPCHKYIFIMSVNSFCCYGDLMSLRTEEEREKKVCTQVYTGSIICVNTYYCLLIICTSNYISVFVFVVAIISHVFSSKRQTGLVLLTLRPLSAIRRNVKRRTSVNKLMWKHFERAKKKGRLKGNNSKMHTVQTVA